jgi:hypothetical protein
MIPMKIMKMMKMTMNQSNDTVLKTSLFGVKAPRND